jgi:hypothetical protein
VKDLEEYTVCIMDDAAGSIGNSPGIMTDLGVGKNYWPTALGDGLAFTIVQGQVGGTDCTQDADLVIDVGQISKPTTIAEFDPNANKITFDVDHLCPSGNPQNCQLYMVTDFKLTLAHEIGHFLGFKDVGDENNTGCSGSTVMFYGQSNPLPSPPDCADFNAKSWWEDPVEDEEWIPAEDPQYEDCLQLATVIRYWCNNGNVTWLCYIIVIPKDEYDCGPILE